MSAVAPEATGALCPPEPGLYQNVEYPTYRAWPAASNTALGKMLRSPAHMRESQLTPDPPTPAKILGNAIHTLTLGTPLFASVYAVADQCCAQKSKGSDERCPHPGKVINNGDWYCGKHGDDTRDESKGFIVLSSYDFYVCKKVREAVFAHKAARALLESAAAKEVSAVWTDPTTGVLCKARADALAPDFSGGPTIIDIKSCEDASPHAFRRSIFNFGYFRQAGFYLDGFNATTEVDWEHFAIIACEKVAPWGVGVYRVLEDACEAGRYQLRGLLEQFKACQDANEWPAYPAGVVDIDLPVWAANQIYSIEG